jgi:streptomycin 6-kinase
MSSGDLDLPAEFVRNILGSFPSGTDWLRQLPGLVETAAERWNLTLGSPYPLSYNYVCRATRRDGTPVVLKIGVPNRELTSEIETLRFYDGQGACRILEGDPDNGLLLLERLQPGDTLATLTDDDQATSIAADVMRQTHRPVAGLQAFLFLQTWLDELKQVRPKFAGGTGPFPEKSFAMVEDLLPGLMAEDRPRVLLHGDFHHDNILSSSRGWLVIDPKGVVGPAEYEVGPLLMNPYRLQLGQSEAIHRTERRIGILSERLGFDRQRLRAWAICSSVLSAFWDMAPDGSGGESSRAWTEVFLKVRV